MDNALDARGLSSLAQPLQPVDVNGMLVVAGTVLQGSGAIDHRIDAGEDFGPVGRIRHGQIGLDPANHGEAPLGLGDVASGAVDDVAVAGQARDDRAANQSVAAENQNTHDLSLRGSCSQGLEDWWRCAVNLG